MTNYEQMNIASTNIPKIKNGSEISFGKDRNKITIYTDHHFNWFQKKNN